MTWAELKNQIRDLGFEDDYSMQEYESIVRNAVNHAINTINYTVVLPLRAYFKAELSTDEEEWTVPVIKDITSDTPDDFEIQLPLMVQPLIKLLASHYVWLDDDLTKATYYYNEYDDLMNQIKQACYATTRIVIGQGLRL
jgi:hypothetical protein|nr:MAG TPA: hypothetical protein [Caudoviricetes sp.]